MEEPTLNFQPELAAKVMAGTKTVTRRLVNDNPNSPWYRERCGLELGKDYAVCPGRGKHAICRVIVTDVVQQRVSSLTEEEAVREGFATPEEFDAAFLAINGPQEYGARVWRIEFTREGTI